jgi:hypothetical protein
VSKKKKHVGLTRKRGTPDPVFDPLWRRDFASDLLSSGKWIAKAEELLWAAAKLEPDIRAAWRAYRAATKGKGTPPPRNLFGQYFMLSGFAIENLLNGVIVFNSIPTAGYGIFQQAERSIFFSAFLENGKLPEALKSHDLFWLSKELAIPLTLEEEDLLRRLTRSAVWFGRYPVSIDWEELGPEKYSDGAEYSKTHFSGDDVSRVKRFIKSLEQRFDFKLTDLNARSARSPKKKSSSLHRRQKKRP